MACAQARSPRGCPFLASPAAQQAAFRDSILAAPLDVEELAAAGREAGCCPYYAARAAAPHADVVMAPYSAVLVPVGVLEVDVLQTGC